MQTKYQVKAEYRDAQKLSTASSHHSVVSGGQRRDSYGLYRDQMARRSLRRPASVSEGVYTIPETELTLLPHGQYNIGDPVTTGPRGLTTAGATQLQLLVHGAAGVNRELLLKVCYF